MEQRTPTSASVSDASRALGRVRRLTRATVVLVSAIAVVAAGIGVPGVSGRLDVAQAANRSEFVAGNIISDAVFFDSGSMSLAEITSFIAAKGSTCVAGTTGTPCLKNFAEDTWTRSATGCPGAYVGGAAESAATIIYKVAQACGISPKALLVLLQKEQSLVTASGSSLRPSRYRSATGFGCPDTAPCDAQYYGFFNQVFLAARQFKLYAASPSRYGYRAGEYNQVKYHPDAACGSSSLYIQNAATAGLYNYTPYQPNNAILAGSGDGCSSYGNLNFWTYFVDWFGTTQWPFPVRGAFGDLWASLGYSASPLGLPTTAQMSGLVNGGSYQEFARGTIYSSPATGTHYVSGGIRSEWASTGLERGILGYPISDPVGGSVNGGVHQDFEGGTVYWSSTTGAHYVSGGIRSAWALTGSESGVLGYPRYDPAGGLAGGGVYQDFVGGSVYWSPATGAHYVSGGIRSAWGATGWENGVLGYPLYNPGGGLTGGGVYQDFVGGSVYWSPATGAHYVSGAIRTAWGSSGWEKGPLGYPTSEPVKDVATGLVTQMFQNGRIVSTTPTTAVAVLSGPILDAWLAAGGAGGVLGAPLYSAGGGLTGGGVYQDFVGGSVYWSASTGAHYVTGAIRTAWGAAGWENGRYGYPSDDPVTAGGQLTQRFQNGTITVPSA